MADRKPVKVLPDGGGDSAGLAEFVAADTIGVVDGGTGLATVATSNILTGNGTGALSAEANLRFDGSKLEIGAAATVSSSADGFVVNDGANAGMTIYSTGTSSGQMKLSLTNAEGADAGAAMIYNNSGDYLFFNVNGATERLRILGTGGITFNGDTAAANALDDYEEGTWTPVIKYGGASGTAYSLNSIVATYTKIGRVVYFSCEVEVTNTSASNDGSDVNVSGLPFTAANTAQWWRVHNNWNLYTNSVGVPMGAVYENSTVIVQYQQQNNGAWGGDIDSSEIYQSSGSVWFHSTGFYHVG